MIQRGNCTCGGVYCVRGGRLLCGVCGKPSPIAAQPPEGPVAGPHNHVAHDPQAWGLVGDQNRQIAELADNIDRLNAHRIEAQERATLAEAALLPAYLALRSGQNKWRPAVDWLEGVKAILEKAGLVDEQGRPIIRDAAAPAATPVCSDAGSGASPLG